MSAERRRGSAALSKKVREAEALVDRLSREKQDLLAKLADPALYRDEPDEAKQLQRQVGRLQRDLDAAESEWVAGQEQLEDAAKADGA